MGLLANRATWMMAGSGAAMLAAAATRKGLRKGWRLWKKEEPPRRPWRGDWRDALLWTAGVGLAAGLMRLVARRVTAEGWRYATGDDPPA